jgi:hypothetical protein
MYSNRILNEHHQYLKNSLLQENCPEIDSAIGPTAEVELFRISHPIEELSSSSSLQSSQRTFL